MSPSSLSLPLYKVNMKMNNRCIESVALTAFCKDSEKIRVEMMKPMEENEKIKENYDVGLLINDLPMNLKLVLLKPSKLNEVSTFAGASVSIKGRYIPPEEKNNDISKDQFLNLHIQGPNKQSILLALQMIEHLVKDSAGFEEEPSVCQVEKVLVGMEVAPAEFDLRGRVLGPEGSNLQYIVGETEAEVTLRGRGSGYEEPDIGKESPEPLHIRVQHARPEVVQAGRILALHLVETVQQEFAEYCSQQARLMVTPQPDAFLEQQTRPSPLSEGSWSPSGHSAYIKDDCGESEVWLDITASPHSGASSRGSTSENVEKDNPEPSKRKRSESEEKKTDVDQKDDEKKTSGITGEETDVDQKDDEKKTSGITGEETECEKDKYKTDTEKPWEYVPWSMRRTRRGGKKSKMYREKINMYTEALEKLHKQSLQPEERKELVEIIKVLKPKLASWWYVKKYGNKDLETQYQKICVEKECIQRQKEITQKRKSSLPVPAAPGNIHRPRAPLLPLPRPMSSGYMTPPTMCRPPSSSRPPFMQPGPMPGTFQSPPKTPGLLPTHRPRPPPAMDKPCYVHGPSNSPKYSQNNQQTISNRLGDSADPVASHSFHCRPPNQPPRGQQNNQNCVGVQGKQWSETQAPQNYNYDQGNRREINLRPPLQNPSQNEFSQGQWHNQSSTQNFQGHNPYPAPNHLSILQNFQGSNPYPALNHQSSTYNLQRPVPNQLSSTQNFQGPNSYPAPNQLTNAQNFQGPIPFPAPNQNFANSWGQQNQMQPRMRHQPEQWQSPTQIPQGIPRPLTPRFWQSAEGTQTQSYQRMPSSINNRFCSPQNSWRPHQ